MRKMPRKRNRWDGIGKGAKAPPVADVSYYKSSLIVYHRSLTKYRLSQWKGGILHAYSLHWTNKQANQQTAKDTKVGAGTSTYSLPLSLSFSREITRDLRYKGVAGWE